MVAFIDGPVARIIMALCFSQCLLPLRRFALQATPDHDGVFTIYNIPLPQSSSPPPSSAHQNHPFLSRSGALRLPSSQFSKSLSCVKRQSWIPNAQHSCNMILSLCNTFFKKSSVLRTFDESTRLACASYFFGISALIEFFCSFIATFRPNWWLGCCVVRI